VYRHFLSINTKVSNKTIGHVTSAAVIVGTYTTHAAYRDFRKSYCRDSNAIPASLTLSREEEKEKERNAGLFTSCQNTIEMVSPQFHGDKED
jgi:hypothetical protein